MSKRYTNDQRTKAQVIAEWIEQRYPDFFARAKRGKNGVYYTNSYSPNNPRLGEIKKKNPAFDIDSYGTTMHAETIGALSKDYDSVTPEQRNELGITEVENSKDTWTVLRDYIRSRKGGK